MYSTWPQRVTQLEVGGQLLLRPSLFAIMVTRPVSLLTRAFNEHRAASLPTCAVSDIVLCGAGAAAAVAVMGLPALHAGVRTKTRNRGAHIC